MLKIHDDVISSINKIIKQTHVHHEKQIQRLEKEIKQKDGFSLIIQEVIIKVIHSAQNFVDTPNHKFDTILLVM